MLFALFGIPRSTESAVLAFRMIAAPALFIIVAALVHRYVERPSIARLSAFLTDPLKVRRQRQASALPVEA
jgi:peptidoglycan/LPS O-acetylase OafA/YrhL